MINTTKRPEGGTFRRRSTKHDRTGCLTCRHRRKKCTENTFPVCGACQRLNLECVREPVRRVVPNPVDGSDPCSRCSASGSISLHLTPAPFGAPSHMSSPYGTSRLDSSHKRHAMRYYITVLAMHLTVSEQSNSFLSVFLPMAMESVPLSDALVAFSAGHLALGDAKYEVAALEARDAAIRGLTTAIDTPSGDISWHETNAAACLALLTSEISLGDYSGSWYSHLQAASHIITSAGSTTAFKDSLEGRWILRNFAYHDIIGSVTLRRRPLLDGSYLDDISDVVDSYLGVATLLLRFVARIGCLEEETRVERSMTLTADEVRERKVLFHTTCAQLERELLEWSCPAETAPGLAAVAYSFRAATLLLFYRLVRSRLQAQAAAVTTYQEEGQHDASSAAGISPNFSDIVQIKINTQVAAVLDAVADIPVGDAPESALLFPLFIAGGEAVDQGQIMQVRTRLLRTLEKRSFRNISLALDILEQVWGLRGKQVAQVASGADWAPILEATGRHLVLT